MENNEQPEQPVLDTRRMRESKVLSTDIAGIREPNRAPKNFATNQGVREFVKQEVGKSEVAISHAMTEVFAQFNEATLRQDAQLQALIRTFEQCIRIHSNRITQFEIRIHDLETRWWERLMCDLEWDWYGIVDWTRALFRMKAVDVTLDTPKDSAIITLDDYLHPDPEDYQDGVDEAPTPLSLTP